VYGILWVMSRADCPFCPRSAKERSRRQLRVKNAMTMGDVQHLLAVK